MPILDLKEFVLILYQLIIEKMAKLSQISDFDVRVDTPGLVDEYYTYFVKFWLEKQVFKNPILQMWINNNKRSQEAMLNDFKVYFLEPEIDGRHLSNVPEFPIYPTFCIIFSYKRKFNEWINNNLEIKLYFGKKLGEVQMVDYFTKKHEENKQPKEIIEEEKVESLRKFKLLARPKDYTCIIFTILKTLTQKNFYIDSEKEYSEKILRKQVVKLLRSMYNARNIPESQKKLLKADQDIKFIVMDMLRGMNVFQVKDDKFSYLPEEVERVKSVFKNYSNDQVLLVLHDGMKKISEWERGS